MKQKIIYSFYFIITLFFSIDFSNAQQLPANQPEQDACNALVLCGNSFFTPYGYQGIGTVSDMFTTPCGSGEANSLWLKLIITAPGTIVFTITPVVGTNDYDFAVIDATNTTCNNLSSSNVIRCNFNNNSQPNPYYTGGIVGLSTTSSTNNVTSGANGQQFCAPITANAGDIYLIMVNNYGDDNCSGTCPGSGFTIDFTGSTATFFSFGAPTIDSLAPACDYSQGLSMSLSQNVNCASIATDGSDFYLTPSGTISSVTGINCNAQGQGYTDSLQFTFNPPLPPGTYTIHSQVGSDTNTLLNLCTEAMDTTQQISFTIPPYPAYQSIDIACSMLTIHTTIPILCNSIATNGSDFHLTGPDSIAINSAAGINCNANGFTNTIQIMLNAPIDVAGNYTLLAQQGTDGNTLLDSCNRTQTVGDSISFSTPSLIPTLTLPSDLTTCINAGIALPLSISNADPNANYHFLWLPATGLNNDTLQQPFALPTTTQMYSVTVFSNDPAYCTAYDTITLNMLQGFDILNNDTNICYGASVAISTQGSNQYSYAWMPNTYVSDPTSQNTQITPPQSGLYALVASYPGCPDSTQYININVQASIDINLGADQTICYGDSAIIEATISPMQSNYTYLWSPNGAYTEQGNPDIIYYGDTSINLVLTVNTPSGCGGTDTIAVNILPELFTQAVTNNTGFCSGDSVQLSIIGGDKYQWSPSYGLSNDTKANPIASPETPTDYTVVISNAQGCKDTQIIHVNVYPNAVINIPDSVKIFPGESYQISPETNCLYFQWFPPSGLNATNISNPIAQPSVRTRYFVTATTENACKVADSLDVLVEGTVIDMPNAFTPGSGVNNIFKPSLRGNVTLTNFSIYNRWGEKMFETNDINKGWDGTFNGKSQPMGVYVYTIQAMVDGSKPFVKQGNVTLMR